MPASRIASSAWNRIGAPATGISCFAFVWVSGRSRDPSPPARINARIRWPLASGVLSHQASGAMQSVVGVPLPTGSRWKLPEMNTATGLPRSALAGTSRSCRLGKYLCTTSASL